MTDYDTLARRAHSLLPAIRHWAAQAQYERAGILNSEILFLVACLQHADFGRLLESGRARGQSTLLLSLAFPDRSILSVESNENSPDVAVAGRRLRDRENVTLLFGDARKLLPKMIQCGDVILIDGPKAFRAVRLALRLLASGKVTHVFVHDLTIETPERRFVNRNFPEARFSDHIEFATVAAAADAGIEQAIPPFRRLGGFTGVYGYGCGLAYLPYTRSRPYRWLLCKAFVNGLFTKARAFMRKSAKTGK
jgi:predicted O-methyltransferase YrrM